MVTPPVPAGASEMNGELVIEGQVGSVTEEPEGTAMGRSDGTENNRDQEPGSMGVDEHQSTATGTTRRSQRRLRRIPARYRDIPPSAPPTLDEAEAQGESGPAAQPTGPRRVILHVRDQLQTKTNLFGLSRKFYERPSYDPDGELTLEDLAGLTKQREGGDANITESRSGRSAELSAPYHPFPNASTFLLSNYWMATPSGERSDADFERLVASVLDPRFHPEEVRGFSAKKMKDLLDGLDVPSEDEAAVLGGWKRNVSVSIQIPEGKKHWTNPEGRTFTIPGLHLRSITELVRTVFSTDPHLHFTPFKYLWKPSKTAPEQRVYSDIYCSPAFEAAHIEVNRDPKFAVPGCKLEKVVAALMAWSDSTHLAQFGTANLWPIYLEWGNHFKFFCGKPNTHMIEHLAYIPSVRNTEVWSLTTRYSL